MNLSHYQNFARIFDFPDFNYKQASLETYNFLKTHCSTSAQYFESFHFQLPKSEEKTEELYIKSFDVQAITTLDLGYLLFGDDYKRGEMLVHLNREHQNFKVDCLGQLADHLPNVLRLLAKHTDIDFVEEFVSQMLVPSLCQMVYEFQPERLKNKQKAYKKHYKTLIEDAKNNHDLYLYAILSLSHCTAFDFKIELPDFSNPRFETPNDFLTKVKREILIEKYQGKKTEVLNQC